MSADDGAGQISRSRALLVLIEGAERSARDSTWPELRQRSARAQQVLTRRLDAARANRFAVDRAALCALRRLTDLRTEHDATASACFLSGLLGNADARALTDLPEPWLNGIPESVPRETVTAFEAVAGEALAELHHAVDRNESYASPLGELNPHAGRHAIPDDLRAIAVAVEVGQRSFDEYAYYALRYGERGRAFTRTDSAWLVAIAGLRLDVVRQISWLSTVLSTRGMPSLLLESHLDVLADSLEKALPTYALHSAALREAAAVLRKKRLLALPDADARQGVLVAALEATPRSERSVAIEPREAALLAVAALADARGGIRGAAENMLDWLADGTRFGNAWCTAVTHALVET